MSARQYRVVRVSNDQPLGKLIQNPFNQCWYAFAWKDGEHAVLTFVGGGGRSNAFALAQIARFHNLHESSLATIAVD